MNADLQLAIEKFIHINKEGKVIARGEILELNVQLGGLLPEWFVEIMITYPLSGAEFDFSRHEPDDEYDGYCSLQLVTLQYLHSETLTCYPGIAIKELGYFCIGIDPTGSGDQYFTSNRRGDNPPVYQVYHDVGETPEAIEEGMVEIAGSLSELFFGARFI